MTMEMNAETMEDTAVEAPAEMPIEMAEPVLDIGTMRALEAMLFASTQPLSLNAMRERLPEGADIGGMLMELQKSYEDRGVHLMDMAGQWAFRTAADVGDVLQLKREVRRPLSRAAMETLAIVAYHQPVTRAEIENIRGVVISGGTLDILMELGWIKPGRRREAPGRPLTWVTTTNFLDQFGLQSLTDLPGLDDLKVSGLLDRRPAIETTTGDMFEEMVAEDEEMEAAEEDAMATEAELAALRAEGSDEESGDDAEEDEDDSEDQSEEDEDSSDDEDENSDDGYDEDEDE